MKGEHLACHSMASILASPLTLDFKAAMPHLHSVEPLLGNTKVDWVGGGGALL